ncbi:MAG: DAHL domain-containing protein [Gammaproteobacteria bacterium]
MEAFHDRWLAAHAPHLLVFLSRSPDLALRARMHDLLQSLQLHDAELTREVLLARAGLLPNYDSLAHTEQRLSRSLNNLRAESAKVTGDAAETLGGHIKVLTDTLQHKLTLIEYFKSDNALLRNSLAYFFYSGQDLGAAKPIAEEVAALSHAMLRFLQAPEPDVGNETQLMLERLSRTPALAPGVQTVVTHGRLIVDVLPELDTLLRQMIATPTAIHADGLQEAVLRYSDRAEARAQVSRFLLYLVALTLLAYLIRLFARLRASARELRLANVELQHEMSRRHQTLAELQASEERFRAITQSANDAIVSANSSGTIVSWNPSAEAIFGYKKHEVLGAPLTLLIPPRYHAAHLRGFAEWARTGCFRLGGATAELAGLRKSGVEFPLEISISTWSTAQDRYVTATLRDLTARKRLEETTRWQQLQLIQANKMTALGTLVSSVAHEINNPNQLVQMNAKVLADAWEDVGEILDAYQRESDGLTLGGLPYREMRENIPILARGIHQGALRIERIVNDLRDFARPRPKGAQALFDLNEAVQRALRLFSHQIKSRTHHLHVDLAPNVPFISGDDQQVEQIVVNLVTNALEALPDQERKVIVTTLFDQADGQVILEVWDEGVGIPPEHFAQLCDPFFTTRQDSGGTGLGLAITSSLVRTNGGQLGFTSEIGKGTRATVKFPVRDKDTPAERAECERA